MLKWLKNMVKSTECVQDLLPSKFLNAAYLDNCPGMNFGN